MDPETSEIDGVTQPNSTIAESSGYISGEEPQNAASEGDSRPEAEVEMSETADATKEGKQEGASENGLEDGLEDGSEDGSEGGLEGSESFKLAKKERRPWRSRSRRAGLLFPTSRIRGKLRKKIDKRIRMAAALYTTAVIEYLTAELLELSGNVASDVHRKRITPRHIMIAVKVDNELNELLSTVTMPSAGVMPFIHPILVKSKNQTDHKAEK